ncbi:hypothetical protein GmHk_03G007144 [Glycine max]|nr:hypothetical protein GmHk_03G007144 [Glycine max]
MLGYSKRGVCATIATPLQCTVMTLLRCTSIFLMEPVPFFPWGFLNKPSISSHQEHTFVQALNHVCNIPLNQLPMLCLKGEPILVTILEDKYGGSLEGCKNHLNGRIILPKGAKPISLTDLRLRLSKLWQSLKQWNLTPIGKGFFEYQRKVLSVGSWGLSPGFLRLYLWTLDFNPSSLLLIDDATNKRTFGHYARVLVDMDFARVLGDQVLVDITYERLP